MRAILTGAIAGVLMLAGTAIATAAEPRWSHPRDVGAVGYRPSAVVDDRGRVSVVWQEQLSGRVLGAVREPGAAMFTKPFQVTPADGSSPSLFTTPNGELAVITVVPVCGGGGCRSMLQARIGPDLRRLGRVQTLAEPGFGAGVAVAPDGRMLAAWSSSLHAQGRMQAAERLPGARGFGPTFDLDQSGGTPPRVALNERGAAVVAWGRAPFGGDGGHGPRVTVRPAGGRFGRPQRVEGPTDTGLEPQITIAADGTVTMAVAGRQPGYRVLPPGAGAFGPLVPFSNHAAESMDTSANSRGAAAALWLQHIPGTGETRERPYDRGWYAAVRGAGATTFGLSRPLNLTSYVRPTAGLDAHGNLLLAWSGAEGDGRLRAGALTRFDLAPSELTPPLTGPRTIAGRMSVNSHGHAVLPFSEGGDQGPIRFIERAADLSPPVLTLGPVTVSPLSVSAPVRCTKHCRAGAHLLAGRRRTASASRSTVIRKGQVRIVRTTLSRRAARRLARRGDRIRLEVRAYDAWGNRRVVRRRVSAARLLSR